MLTEKLFDVFERFGPELAVVSSTQKLTYDELAVDALTTAKHLIDSGLSKGKVVAIYNDRSANTISIMLAIMLSGAAYTIVEEDDNTEENCQRLLTIQPDLVICPDHYVGLLTQNGLSVISISYVSRLLIPKPAGQPEWLPKLKADDIGYVLYTSGSTGIPKGVQVSHRNISHYCISIQQYLSVNERLQYAHLSTLAADLGNTSLFLSLFTGGCLHLIDSNTRKDPKALTHYFYDKNIEFLKITPSHWKAMFGIKGEFLEKAPTLSYLIFGGESLPKSLAQSLLEKKPTLKLFNHYGPTETTVGVTALAIKSLEALENFNSISIPIGKAFGNSTLFVKDQEGRFHTHDATGELYISGPSVTLGYRNNQDATTQSFIDIAPKNYPPLRAYKTGDQVSVDKHGVFYFQGRIDRQVKINGYRVELEHIENTLKRLPDVKDAVVLYPNIRGRQTLVAAIVSHRHGESIEGLKNQLSGLLPGYMLPQKFISKIDFPRNDNGKTNIKKIFEEIEVDLYEFFENSKSTDNDINTIQKNPYSGESLQLYDLLQPLFQTYLKLSYVDPYKDFDELGGDSLLFIQLIADLQYQGYDISANEFMETPTIDGVINILLAKNIKNNHKHDIKESPVNNCFSSAQDDFFRQKLASPSHYNQTTIFSIKDKIDSRNLQQSLELVLHNHELLRTRYMSDNGQYCAERLDCHGIVNDSYSESDISDLNDDQLPPFIQRKANDIQKSISIEEGHVFHAHAFMNSKGESYLLMIAHHLCVDVISWRIIVSELTRIYGDLTQGLTVTAQPGKQSFWRWSEHLDNHFSEEISDPEAKDSLSNQDKGYFPHTEGETESYWFGFDQNHTDNLHQAAAYRNMPLPNLLLGCIAHCFGQASDYKDTNNKITIDVESHGRLSMQQDIDASRIVGWHTSTFPVSISLCPENTEEICQQAQLAYKKINHLGVANSIARKLKPHTRSPSSICFNYLGDTNFNHDERLPMSPCYFDVGTTRGDDNIRNYEIKISARISNRQLIIDVSYPKALGNELIKSLTDNLRLSLNEIAGKHDQFMGHILESGSKTGMLHYIPPSLICQEKQVSPRKYENILLTGATGYIGIHCLRELLKNTSATIHCLTRPTKNRTAKERLDDAIQWYFPSEDWSPYNDRIKSYSSDLTIDYWGLNDIDFKSLCQKTDAVYHLAADTRLMSSESTLIKNNLNPLENILSFCVNHRSKDLHYMSTLAVCGINTSASEKTFTEDHLDIGQEFQNSYEKTKFLAEQRINRYMFDGNRAFIYRTGNVSGHSRTARFQRNSSDNRLIQFLNACVKLGRIPKDTSESLCLSPVDTVAQGLIALSMDPQQKPGTFHIDSSHSLTLTDLFYSLKRHGIPLHHSDHQSFHSLFQDANDQQDPDIIIGRFWSTRKPRNIAYSHQRSDRSLQRLGIEFKPLDKLWLSNFIRFLLEENSIKIPNIEILHLDTFRRQRIFEIPLESKFPQEAI